VLGGKLSAGCPHRLNQCAACARVVAADYVSKSSFYHIGDVGCCKDSPQNHCSGGHDKDNPLKAKLFGWRPILTL
jgi:hypothetical protein